MISAAVTLPRCQVIGGFAGHEIVDPGEGGSDAGGSGGAGGDGQGGGGGVAAECMLRREPARPEDARPGGEESFTLAAQSVELGEDLDLPYPLGLDIDGACTCSATETCACAAAPTCARPTIVDEDKWQRCDDEEGIDANSKRVFSILKAFDPLLSSELISAGLAAGAGSILFDVRSYNGLADDDQVIVGVYVSGAFSAAECNSGGPAWDGNDAWPIDRKSVFVELPACGLTPAPRVFDPVAHVVDHQLVVQLDELTFGVQLGPASLRLTLNDAVAIVPLQRDDADGLWRTEGAILSGRWSLDDVFRALGEFDQVGPADICNPDSLGSTQSAVCAFADTATHARPDAPCDAISFGVEFSATEAKIGNTIEFPVSQPCQALLDLDCETAAP